MSQEYHVQFCSRRILERVALLKHAGMHFQFAVPSVVFLTSDTNTYVMLGSVKRFFRESALKQHFVDGDNLACYTEVFTFNPK